jgi:hypothetical protein
MIFMFRNLPSSMMVGVAASRKIHLLLFFLVFSSGDVISQNFSNVRNYEITVLGFKIGEMTANRSKSSDSTLYEVKSNVSFWFFGKVNVDFRLDSRFANNQIVWTRSFSKSNKGDFQSEVKWNGRHYEVDASTYRFENSNPIYDPVSLSSVMLFFHEPKSNQDFLGEVFGLVTKVKRISEGTYEVSMNGNTNRYYYENGIMVKAEMQSSIKNYLIKLVK